MITFYTDIRCCVTVSWNRGSDIQQSLVRSKILLLVAGRSCQDCCLYYSTRLLVYVGEEEKTMWILNSMSALCCASA